MFRNCGRIVGIVLMVCWSGVALAADSVMFNYQGRVKVHGVAFAGTGQFKFAIVNNPGDVTLWSNDGTSVGGNEPSASLSIPVTDGVFTVMIGDTGAGMQALNSSVFNHPSQIKLRTWFSDGTHGFQQLLPDHRLVNPELIGVLSGTEDFTIYVNGATGNDENNGLTTDTAKRTIQAAVDVLPDFVRANVTVKVASGVYREMVSITGITLAANKILYIKGDETWTPGSGGSPAVRVTGTDDDITPVNVRREGFLIFDCTNLRVIGFTVDHTSEHGFAVRGGYVTFQNCKSEYNTKDGFDLYLNTAAEIKGCVAEHNEGYGFSIIKNCSANLTDCAARYNGQHGVMINRNSSGIFYGTGDYSNNVCSGVFVVHLSLGEFTPAYSGLLSNNSQYGLEVLYTSHTLLHTRNTFSGNGLGSIHLQFGGQTY